VDAYPDDEKINKRKQTINNRGIDWVIDSVFILGILPRWKNGSVLAGQFLDKFPVRESWQPISAHTCFHVENR
jgi:hypothetical protein